MVLLRLPNIFFVVSLLVLQISASTHWVVTENGRIQAQVRFWCRCVSRLEGPSVSCFGGPSFKIAKIGFIFFFSRAVLCILVTLNRPYHM